ncbi:50S ribosomal protein L29 [bacterium]|nr:50S ribosomal protein L29 [bacterium]
MRAHDWRTMDKEEVGSRIENLVAEYQMAREDVRSGKQKNHRQLRALRADIARARTVLQEL